MAIQHVVVSVTEDGDEDVVGRIDLPRGVSFRVPEGYRALEANPITDDGYEWFYNLPVFHDVIPMGYVGYN
jgi:hypothetical protein